MKQLSIFDFYPSSNKTPTLNNELHQKDLIEFVSENKIGGDKENVNPNLTRQQKILKIGKISTHLSLIKPKTPLINKAIDVLNIIDENETTGDEKESKNAEELRLMEHNGFYSNDAVCVTSWTNREINQETALKIEEKEFTLLIEGEPQLKRHYGGYQYSDVAISKRRKGTKRRGDSPDRVVKKKYKKPIVEDQWEVEKIISKKIVSEQGMRITHYFLKWKGWDYIYCTWEQNSEGNSISNLMKKFNRRLKWRESISRRVSVNDRTYYAFNYLSPSLLECHQWEDEMNRVIKEGPCRQAPIYVENWIDDESRPKNFKFIIQNVFSAAAEQSFNGIEKLQHCFCAKEGKKCGGVQDCCPEIFGQNYCYMEDGTLNPRQVRSDWIVECTDACNCDLSCPTRIVQRGRQIPVVLFRTHDRGWSIRTCVAIKKHKFVCEYIGEILTADEALDSKKPSTYQFQIDGIRNANNFKYIVDAATMGNEGRFINHSCNPNLVVRSVFADRLDQDYLRIAFFSRREIRPGDELTIDYCAIDQYAKGRHKEECRCNSKKCKGVYYY